MQWLTLMILSFKIVLTNGCFISIGCEITEGGKAPIDRVVKRSSETPITDEVEEMYDPSKERIKEANYSLDLQISKLKGCL
jgi:hypothetical protein